MSAKVDKPAGSTKWASHMSNTYFVVRTLRWRLPSFPPWPCLLLNPPSLDDDQAHTLVSVRKCQSGNVCMDVYIIGQQHLVLG